MRSTTVAKEVVLNNLSNFEFELLGLSPIHDSYDVSSLNEAQAASIVWFKGTDSSTVESTRSTFVICSNDFNPTPSLLRSKTFIRVKNPKLVISHLISECFAAKISTQIHPSASIHPEAKIGKNVFIGPFVYIGKVEIGDDCVIWGQSYIYNNVVIGNNVEIHAGCVIGEIGSGFTKNERNEYVKFPHIGGVIIEENVEIGALTYVNRGSLSDTIIKRGAKIGNAVCIGHNVIIGEDSMIIANTVVAGSAVVGKNCWLAHSCSIRNGISLGDNVFIGMGSVVTSNCKSNSTLFGNPAKDKKDHTRWMKIKKELLKVNT